MDALTNLKAEAIKKNFDGVKFMWNWESVSKDTLRTIAFERTDPEETEVQQQERFRLPDTQLGVLKEKDDTNRKLLSRKIQELVIRSSRDASNMFSYVGTKCALSETAVRNAVNGNRPITQECLAFLCVGLKVPMKEAEEMFNLFGHPLTFGVNYFESVTMCAIRDRDEMEEYLDDLKKGGVKLRGIAAK